MTDGPAADGPAADGPVARGPVARGAAPQDVGVVLAVRDGERYLGEAIGSVLAEGVGQVVVCDDGSADRSAALAESYGPPVVVLRLPPRGPGAALNAGVAAARTPLLGFVDADDVWTSGRLAPLLAAVGARDADGRLPDGAVGRVVNTDAALRPVGEPTVARLLGAMLLRREAVARVGPWRTDVVHGAAVDWVARAARAGVVLAEVDAVVQLRRLHDANMGRDTATARRDLLTVLRDHRRRGDGARPGGTPGRGAP